MSRSSVKVKVTGAKNRATVQNTDRPDSKQCHTGRVIAWRCLEITNNNYTAKNITKRC